MDFLLHLMQQEDAAAKIRHMYELIKDADDSLPLTHKVFRPKSDAASLVARTQGNQFYKDKNYEKAFQFYNQSICLAPVGSENLAIGYANRSAVYLSCGFYKFCLQNIEFALKNRCPEKLKPKLERRRMECLELMKNSVDGLDKFNKDKVPPELSYPADEKIPFMIQGLEFAKSNEFGRHIRTKRDLYPGKIEYLVFPYIV